jgi:hypothetical protein
MSLYALVPLQLDTDTDRDLVRAAGSAAPARHATALRWLRRGIRLFREQGWGACGTPRVAEPVRMMMLVLDSDDAAAVDEIRAVAEGGDDLQAVLHSLLWNGSMFDEASLPADADFLAFAAE